MSRCWHQVRGGRKRLADDGGKRAVLRGEHEISRRAIAQGRPGCSACTCMLVCSSCHCANGTRDRGCGKHPVFPAPSGFGRDNDDAQLGRKMSRDRRRIFGRHPRLVRNCARGRGSSTPRLLGSITTASGILDPRLRGDDTGVRGRCLRSCWQRRRKKPTTTQPKAAARIRINPLSPYADLKLKRPSHIPPIFRRPARYCSADDLFSTHSGHPFGLDWSRPKKKSVGKT